MAILLAKRHDEHSGQGTCPALNSYFLSFSNEQILNKANLIGVSLGAYWADRVACIVFFKDNELHIMLTLLKNNDKLSA
jgi:predicted esterase YcpF (UPF0227 family)